MEFLELFNNYFSEVLLLVVDFAGLVFYHKFYGKPKTTNTTSIIKKLEKKVARDYERLKVDESLLEEYKKGDSE